MICPRCARHWCLVHAMPPFCTLHACPVLHQRERTEERRVEEAALQCTEHRCPFGEENPVAPQPVPPEGYSWDNSGKGPSPWRAVMGQVHQTRQQPQSPNYSKLRVRVFGKSQLPRAALHFPPSGSKSWALFCACFMNLLSTQYPVCVVHMLAKY